MKKRTLNMAGFAELGEEEMKSIYGGLKIGPAWWAIVWDAFNNFGDIRAGISDGFNGKPPRY